MLRKVAAAYAIITAVLLATLLISQLDASKLWADTSSNIGKHWRWYLAVTGLMATVIAVPQSRIVQTTSKQIQKHPVVALGIALSIITGSVAAAWVYRDMNGIATSTGVFGQRQPRALASLQSGVLLAGVVIAAVGFWFNDERRRREDSTLANETRRLEQESTRLERDKERVEEERFFKAVELLGSDNASVRIGAMHALSGLARTNGERTQTVVDVMTNYLRRRFRHPDQDAHPDEEDPKKWRPSPDERELRDDEYQVRRAAQSQLSAILRLHGTNNSNQNGPVLDLDFTGASLDGLSVTGVRCNLLLTDARVFGPLDIEDCSLVKVDFFGLQSGRVRIRNSHFESDVSLEGAQFNGSFVLSGSVVEGDLDAERLRLKTRLGTFRIMNSRLRFLYGPEECSALAIEKSTIGGDAEIDGKVRSRVVLSDMHVEGDLILEGIGLPDSARNIDISSVVVRGTVMPPKGWRLEQSEHNRHLRRF